MFLFRMNGIPFSPHISSSILFTSSALIKLLCNFIEIALQHGCSPVNLLHIFRTLSPKNTSGWLPLNFVTFFIVKPMNPILRLALTCWDLNPKSTGHNRRTSDILNEYMAFRVTRQKRKCKKN